MTEEQAREGMAERLRGLTDERFLQTCDEAETIAGPERPIVIGALDAEMDRRLAARGLLGSFELIYGAEDCTDSPQKIYRQLVESSGQRIT